MMRLTHLVVMFVVLNAAAEPHGELLRAVDEIRQENGVAAAAVVLVADEPLCEVLGVTDHATGEPATTEHYLRIGSITKAFTGMALLAASERGQLDLNQPLRDWMPSPPYGNPWAADHPVTLAMLMEHTAGLAELSKKEWDSAQPLTLEDAFEVDPDSRMLRWRPGLHSVYSNTGAGIAAYALERKLAVDFEKWTAEMVFRPLRMTSATFDPVSPLLIGYDSDGKTPIVYWHQLYRSFGAMNVRPCEMATFVRMLIQRGSLGETQVLRPESVARMETPTTTFAARKGLSHGYGFGNYAYISKGRVWHGHGGDADGYLSFYAYNLACKCGYFTAITAFQQRTLRQIRSRIEAWLDPPRPPEIETLASSTPDKEWLGEYIQSARRFPGDLESGHLETAGGQLLFTHAGRSVKLRVVDAHRLARPGDPVPTVAIGEEDGVIYLQGPFGNFEKPAASTAPSDGIPSPTDTADP